MQGRTRVSQITFLILGLVLGCCWLPTGIQGPINLLRTTRAASGGEAR